MSSPHEPASAVSQGPFDVGSEGFDGSAALADLDQSCQILVFQTLQDALTASPPRPEATFERVVKAYATLSRVVRAAADGRLTDAHLAELEQDIEIAGGEISPGLKSKGLNSLATFRAAGFGLLADGFDPLVVRAVCSALNARLQVLAIADIDDLFRAVKGFFADLEPVAANQTALQSFAQLDVERQVLVFESMKAAIQAQPPRHDATFSSLVAAYLAERDVLQSARQGLLDDGALAHLENSLVLAGGVIEPGLWAHGRSSVAAFRAETFRVLQPLLPADVLKAALESLNAGLRESQPLSVFHVFESTRRFFAPLLNENWDSQTLRSFRALDLARQASVFKTIEMSLATNPGLEASIFASAVKAISQERFVVESAAQGLLALQMLQDLRSAIELCGGVIAPGIRSDGVGSIAEFCDQCFVALARVMPKDVYRAAMAAMNTSLKTSAIGSLDDLVAVVRGFTAPLRGVKVAPVAAIEPHAEQRHHAVDTVESSVVSVEEDLVPIDPPADPPVDPPVDHPTDQEPAEDHSLTSAEGEGDSQPAEDVAESLEDVAVAPEAVAHVEVEPHIGQGSDEDHDHGHDEDHDNDHDPQSSAPEVAVMPEAQRGVQRLYPYPIFSLNTPAVAPERSGDLSGESASEAVDDYDEDGSRLTHH